MGGEEGKRKGIGLKLGVDCPTYLSAQLLKIEIFHLIYFIITRRIGF